MTRCHLTEVTFWHLVTTTSARVTASNHVITTSGYWHVETDMILLIFSHKNANRLTFWHWYFDMDILTWTFWHGHFDAVTLTVPWSTLTCDTITPSHGRTLTRSHFCIDIWHLTLTSDNCDTRPVLHWPTPSQTSEFELLARVWRTQIHKYIWCIPIQCRCLI